MVPYLRAANVKDGILELEDVKSMDFSLSEQMTYALRPGDVLVTEGAGSLAAVGATAVWNGELDGVVCYQNTLLRLRPRAGNDPRYLMWWARHAFGSGLFASIAGGANIYHLGADGVRLLPASMPDLASQRAIADYLDAQAEKIDHTIQLLTAANRLVSEWLEAVITHVIWGTSPATTPLMHLTRDDRQIQYGIVLPGPDVEVGVTIVKGGNLFNGVLTASELSKTTPEIEAGYARSRLQSGDVVFAIRGAVGACAVVPPDVAGSNITQDVAMVAPRSDVDSRWLLHVLRSQPVQAQAAARTVGATIRGLNIRDLKRLAVPALGIDQQRSQAARLDIAQHRHDELTAARARQIELLRERRQTLITAAVSGQLEIEGVVA